MTVPASPPNAFTCNKAKPGTKHAPGLTMKITLSLSSSTQMPRPKRAKHACEDHCDAVDNAHELVSDLETNDEIPTPQMLQNIGNMVVLDEAGKSIPFRDLCSGPNATSRVLVIFIRHFFCGNCQEFLRTLSTSIFPSSLLALPTPTSIVIIGCGAPSLIPMYVEETSCRFPIYTDPTQKLFDALGMTRTLNMGHRPEYQRRGNMTNVWESVVQGLRVLKAGMSLAPGDMHQVGGEFLFESMQLDSGSKEEDRLDTSSVSQDKIITWCHRMRNTRDHVELPELREVLGLTGYGVPGKSEKRWEKALLVRKGTALAVAPRTSER